MPNDVLTEGSRVMTEEPPFTEQYLQLGEGGRLFGILTLPGGAARDAEQRPVFVFLSAGLLHRVGPYRLHVRLARELAQMGFSALRVDLAGMGDSPPRSGLTHRQSVAGDFADILRGLDSELGRSPLVLVGLCTGADNATSLARHEQRVVGLILLDPICFPDGGPGGFRARALAAKYANPARYVAWLRRRFKALTDPRREAHATGGSVDPLALRDLPTLEQVGATFASIRERGGRVLCVFTDYASGYYNRSGQLGRVLRLHGYHEFCTELFWPETHHTYWLELHRRRLMQEIKTWARAFA